MRSIFTLLEIFQHRWDGMGVTMAQLCITPCFKVYSFASTFARKALRSSKVIPTNNPFHSCKYSTGTSNISHHFSPFLSVFHHPLWSLHPFRLLRPLQHLRMLGNSWVSLISWDSITGSDTPSALSLVHSVYCAHFSAFCTFLMQNSHSLLRSIFSYFRGHDSQWVGVRLIENM